MLERSVCYSIWYVCKPTPAEWLVPNAQNYDTSNHRHGIINQTSVLIFRSLATSSPHMALVCSLAAACLSALTQPFI